MESKMNTGMLWFDNDPKADFNTKINRATDYYLKKYGQRPDLCYVHPSMKFEPPPKQRVLKWKPTRWCFQITFGWVLNSSPSEGCADPKN
jgi:hypothetical protein